MPGWKAPTPPRPLGREGKKAWSRIWRSGASWIDPVSDKEYVLVLCESIDERVMLRVRVLKDPDDWRSGNRLRALDQQILQMSDALGLNPDSRKAMAVERPVQGKLAELRALRDVT